jgi:hypothetical protein
MRHTITAHPASELTPLPAYEMVSVGIDIGKRSHVAGFLSNGLLARH